MQTKLLVAKVIYRICFPEKTVKWLKAHCKKMILGTRTPVNHSNYGCLMFAEFSSCDFLPSSYKDAASDRQLQPPKDGAKRQESLSNQDPT